MKFGVREICDVVLKAKAAQKVGNKVFYKNEPVIYFDSLKTSSMEGAATTVYAQGGRGNSRLVAWEGERTVTFTMEDALISPAGFMILSGAGLVDATVAKSIKVHTIEQTDDVEVSDGQVIIYVKKKPYFPHDATGAYLTDRFDAEDYAYVMLLEDGEPITEPYIPDETATAALLEGLDDTAGRYPLVLKQTDNLSVIEQEYNPVVLVDYYVERTSGAQMIEITHDKFGGNYYLEASTLFRDTNGVDLPAEFIIPNCKIQSNFTFTMASSGDPSTFTFTMDAFPDYTRFDKTKKVLAAIQIVGGGEAENLARISTEHDYNERYDIEQKPIIEG